MHTSFNNYDVCMAAVDLEFLTVLIREIQIFKRLCTASLGCGPPLHVALNC